MDIDPANRPRTLVDMIATEFVFLIERGFHATVEGKNSVLYANASGVFVRVFRDPIDKYVGFRVGLASRPKDALTAAEIVRLAGVTAHRGEYPEGIDQLDATVARVAQELRTYGERPLSGEVAIFDEAMEMRRQHTRSYMGRESAGSSDDGER
jgi:hypothetical protein